jgi:hypothetical protein
MVNTFFEERAEKLTGVAQQLASALEGAGIQYRVIGGYAIYRHVDAVDPLAARLTRDLDVAVRHDDLERICNAVKPLGLIYRHVAGVDMLVDAKEPKARSAIHMVFVGEKVRPSDIAAIPDFSEPVRGIEGVFLAPVADLVRMKLTSFRFKDKTHLKDMDQVGLITPVVESGLTDVLRERLAEVRAGE